MSTRDLDWNLLRAFIAVLRLGSLSAAARALGQTQPTLGRQIRALEEQLGEALFDRLPKGLRPTPRALALAEHARAMDEAGSRLAAALLTHVETAAGTVRITVPESLGPTVLPPLLAGLMADHPEIDIELSATNQTENLLRRDADIAVRLARPEQEELIAQRVGSLEIGLYAARAYAARHGLPADRRALAGHRLIGPDSEAVGLALIERLGLREMNARFVFRSDSRLSQQGALRAGIGIGALAIVEAGEDSGLLRVLPGWVLERFPVWVVAHPDMRHSRRLRLVYDALVAGLRARFGRPPAR
jgi:DNA-binding transcriptional LysR family regulator